MSEVEPVLGILLSHGRLAEGMVDAVQRIAGLEEGVLVAMSNDGQNPQGLAKQVDVLVGDRPVVVFTDLGSGSCALTAQLTCRNRGRRAVVFGMNLPMLLEFVFHRELPLAQLVPRLLEKGKESVKSAGPADGSARPADGSPGPADGPPE
jgi:mannose/fructose-specific phosphotransferase system component IIA